MVYCDVCGSPTGPASNVDLRVFRWKSDELNSRFNILAVDRDRLVHLRVKSAEVRPQAQRITLIDGQVATMANAEELVHIANSTFPGLSKRTASTATCKNAAISEIHDYRAGTGRHEGLLLLSAALGKPISNLRSFPKKSRSKLISFVGNFESHTRKLPILKRVSGPLAIASIGALLIVFTILLLLLGQEASVAQTTLASIYARGKLSLIALVGLPAGAILLIAGVVLTIFSARAAMSYVAFIRRHDEK